MAFFEVEFPHKIEFKRQGGPAFNTFPWIGGSGQEQRNRNWTNPRAEYVATPLLTNDSSELRLAFIDALRNFFFQIGGMADAFRFYDELDFKATAEPMGTIDSTHFQCQKTYTLAGRTYVRTITKIIGPGASDYKGNALGETFSIVNPAGGTFGSLDHTTGIATFSGAPSGTPTASFQYHIPVRLTSDKFDPEIQPSAAGYRLIKWNSLGLIEVFPPNY